MRPVYFSIVSPEDIPPDIKLALMVVQALNILIVSPREISFSIEYCEQYLAILKTLEYFKLLRISEPRFSE